MNTRKVESGLSLPVLKKRTEIMTRSNIFENLFEDYGSMLYGIALKITPGKKQAEQLLADTFKKLNTDDLPVGNKSSMSAYLVSLIITTAAENIKFNENDINALMLNFNHSPIIQRMISNYFKERDQLTVNNKNSLKPSFNERLNLFYNLRKTL